MTRPQQLVLGLLVLVAGLALVPVIVAVWSPCAGAPMPFDPAVQNACTDISSGENTAWIGLILWPVALVLAVVALVLAVRRRVGAPLMTAAVVLVLAVLLANPVTEYVVLNAAAGSWDEPPGTGAFTAAALVLTGALLLALPQRRRPDAEPAAG